MKKKMRKQMFVCLAVLALMVGWAGFVQPAPVEAASLIVTEAWEFHEGYELYFTVTNDGYTDIREFAIGNNDAEWAGVDTSLSDSPAFLIYGSLAEKIEGQWKTMIAWGEEGQIYRDVTWLDDATGFEDYTRAFLFTSWGWDCSGYSSGYLEEGFTNGYWGSTEMLASPFAAYSESETITGETSAVPIHGAAWLFASGLLGLVGIRRRMTS